MKKSAFEYLLNRSQLIIVSGLLLLNGLYACHSGESKNTEQQEAISEPIVEAVTLQKGKLSSSLQIPGELMAFQQVDLYAK